MLMPLASLYGLGVRLRNKLFDEGILSAKEFPVPIICVGNLTVGGTGKTPHTEFLIKILSERYRVAVLSRGYKRKTKGFVLADEHASASTLGDEPYQMYRKFKSIRVAVDEKRQRGIEQLLNLPEEERPEVILLDDAFQHRYVKPSLAILLNNYNRPIYSDKMLPAGKLREPVDSKHRADIVLTTKCPENLSKMDMRITQTQLELYPYQDLFFTSFRYGAPYAVFDPEKTIDLTADQTQPVVALILTGIATPEPFIQYVQAHTGGTETLSFPDHHAFSAKDLKLVTHIYNELRAENKYILTTEKDAARLLEDDNIPEEIKPFIYAIPIEVTFNFDQEDSFIHKIIKHVTDFKRNSILA